MIINYLVYHEDILKIISYICNMTYYLYQINNKEPINIYYVFV